jgi:uncharacterized membrane protein YdjX (TVP38/TMEM64 family)
VSAPTLLWVALVALLGALLFGGFGDPLALEAPDAALRSLRDTGPWAWAAAIALICTDLVLPVPTTSLIAALGIIYGFVVGAAIGTLALVAAGMLAYAFVRAIGRPAAVLFAGERRLARLEAFFARSGAWAIVLTRGLPILPEVVTSLAGLARMPVAKFALALVVGSLPTAAVFAAIGVGWSDRPGLALLAAYVLPLALLPLALRMTRS